MKYMIPMELKDTVAKLLNKVQKKGERYGKKVDFSFGEECAVMKRVYEGSEEIDKFLVECVELDLEAEVVKQDGYTVVAKIDHDKEGNIVTRYDEGELKAEWFSVEGKCEHCNTKHNRKVTFIVEKDGIEKQVGSSCLRDYCGINPNWIAEWNAVHDEVIRNQVARIDADALTRDAKVYEITKALAAACKVATIFGYVKADEENSNKKRIAEMLNADESIEEEYMSKGAEIAKALKEMDIAEAIEARMDTVAQLARRGYCRKTMLGFAAYAPIAYEKHMSKKRQLIERAKTSEYIGEVGKRIEVEIVDAKCLTWYQTDFGTTYIYNFHDVNGNEIIWKASRAQDIDNAKKIKGTIKAHDEYNGVKQTVMTRCKIA